jgi:translation elongation factor EF-1beta
MERMEQEQKARMLKEMQRGLRGMEQGIRMMDRGLNACRKAKVDVADADASLATIKDIVAKVRAATDPEELPDLMSDLPEHFDKLREVVENCNRVAQLPRITKQLGREIKQLEGEHRRLTSQVKRAKLDLADQLNAIATGIETIKVMLAEVSRVKTTDEFEEAMAKLEGLHDTFEDIRENVDAVRSVLNVRRALTDAKREIRTVERFIGTLKRKGADTSELAEMVAAGKALVAELEVLAKQKPIDADALHEKFEMLEELGGRAEEALAKLRGVKFEDRFEPKFDKSASADVKLPDAFRQFEKEEEPEGPSEIESLLGF